MTARFWPISQWMLPSVSGLSSSAYARRTEIVQSCRLRRVCQIQSLSDVTLMASAASSLDGSWLSAAQERAWAEREEVKGEVTRAHRAKMANMITRDLFQATYTSKT